MVFVAAACFSLAREKYSLVPTLACTSITQKKPSRAHGYWSSQRASHLLKQQQVLGATWMAEKAALFEGTEKGKEEVD